MMNQLNDKGEATVLPLFLKQGYVVKHNEQYSVDFASKQGQLFLNNKLLTPTDQNFLLKSIEGAQGEADKKNTLAYQHALEQLQLTANLTNESQLYFRCLRAAKKAGDNNNACNQAHAHY